MNVKKLKRYNPLPTSRSGGDALLPFSAAEKGPGDEVYRFIYLIPTSVFLGVRHRFMEVKKINRYSETGFLAKNRFIGLPNYLFNLHESVAPLSTP